jgi:hypothetical protein
MKIIIPPPINHVLNSSGEIVNIFATYVMNPSLNK